jgi:putative ABC transport system permease protein
MWMLLLALKNLTRNKKRIALSLVSVVAGVAVFIMGQGFNSGLSENILRAQIDKVSGHVLIRPAGYATDTMSPDIDNFFDIEPEASKWLDDNSVAWTRRVTFSPDAIVGPDLIKLRGIVYDPAKDVGVFPHDEWTIDGVMPESGGVMVGSGVADLLNLKVGDWMTLRSRTTGGAVNALETEVLGIVHSGSPMMDATSVLVPWELGHGLIRNAETTSHVNVRLDSRDGADAFGTEAIQKIGADVEFATWQSETAELMELQKVRANMFSIMAFALLGMAATGIANTILMAAFERIREIGTLRAMGMTRAAVVQLFVIEGALLGLVGAVVGVVLGGLVVWNGSINGMDLTAMMEGKKEAAANMPMSMMLYMDFDPAILLLAFSFGVIVAIGASVYPAFAATQTSPADAVRA